MIEFNVISPQMSNANELKCN